MAVNHVSKEEIKRRLRTLYSYYVDEYYGEEDYAMHEAVSIAINCIDRVYGEERKMKFIKIEMEIAVEDDFDFKRDMFEKETGDFIIPNHDDIIGVNYIEEVSCDWRDESSLPYI